MKRDTRTVDDLLNEEYKPKSSKTSGAILEAYITFDPADKVSVGNMGELHAVAWLEVNGFTVTKHDTKAPGKVDIEAERDDGAILVQVKSSISSEVPADPSSDEIKAIKSRATKTERTAWIAKVTLKMDGSLRRISWSKL